MCGCFAGQYGALWSADGGCPSLRPGPAGLLPGLWLRLQPGSARPCHSGTVTFDHICSGLYLSGQDHSAYLCVESHSGAA